MEEVHVGLVEDHDLALRDDGADLAGALVVVMARGVHDGEGGQEAVEIEPQVHLGRRLAPPVLRPVHASWRPVG